LRHGSSSREPTAAARARPDGALQAACDAGVCAVAAILLRIAGTRAADRRECAARRDRVVAPSAANACSRAGIRHQAPSRAAFAASAGAAAGGGFDHRCTRRYWPR
jgi:hypothetical protein